MVWREPAVEGELLTGLKVMKVLKDVGVVMVEWTACYKVLKKDGVTGSAICSRVPAEVEVLFINELMV